MKVIALKLLVLLGLVLTTVNPASAQQSYIIDRNIAPRRQSMVGLDRGPDRPVGAVVAPNGSRDEFITNEIIMRPASREELEAFLSRYAGTIIRDGTTRLLQGETPRADMPATTGWYLIRIDPGTSTLDDLSTNLRSADMGGQWVFSSDEAARLGALVLRERDKQISPNFLAMPHQTCVVCEHPTAAGGNLDAATWWWMTEDNNPTIPGNQGLSIGVIRAWEYLKYQGYPREGVLYYPVYIAVLDSGFDLDTTTGVPLNGNKDYLFAPPRPLQLDEVDGDWRAGGEHGHGWHGQSVFGVCCAFARNSWGTAGISGGSDIKTLLIRVDGDLWTLASGVYDALYNNADVINISWGGDCGWFCDTFGNGNVLRAAIGSARNVGAVVVASAGNDAQDISDSDIYSCKLSGSICVGAIDQNGNAKSYSNWGTGVDIWAPAGIRSTVTRDSSAIDPDNFGIDELANFEGTSAAAPFVTGVVAMMKMLNSNLYHSQIETILANTARSSTDPKVSVGYIDAFAAVEAAKPNQPPIVKITAPVAGATIGYSNVSIAATVTDPEKPNAPYQMMFPTTLVLRSDQDGVLCTDKGVFENKGCLVPSLSQGTHVITATAIDAFGATATATISVAVSNTAPMAKITHPADGSSVYAGQSVNLRGYGFDPDDSFPLDLKWISGISYLGSGTNIWVSLPTGTHPITLTATDRFGIKGSDTITLVIKEDTGYPTAKILQPKSGTVIATGTPVLLMGEGIDPEDGAVPGTSLRWSSNHDGNLGIGKAIEITLSGPNCGMKVHDITLEVTDSTGKKGTHTTKSLSAGSAELGRATHPLEGSCQEAIRLPY